MYRADHLEFFIYFINKIISVRKIEAGERGMNIIFLQITRCTMKDSLCIGIPITIGQGYLWGTISTILSQFDSTSFIFFIMLAIIARTSPIKFIHQISAYLQNVNLSIYLYILISTYISKMSGKRDKKQFKFCALLVQILGWCPTTEL